MIQPFGLYPKLKLEYLVDWKNLRVTKLSLTFSELKKRREVLPACALLQSRVQDVRFQYFSYWTNISQLAVLRETSAHR